MIVDAGPCRVLSLLAWSCEAREAGAYRASQSSAELQSIAHVALGDELRAESVRPGWVTTQTVPVDAVFFLRRC